MVLMVTLEHFFGTDTEARIAGPKLMLCLFYRFLELTQQHYRMRFCREAHLGSGGVEMEEPWVNGWAARGWSVGDPWCDAAAFNGGAESMREGGVALLDEEALPAPRVPLTSLPIRKILVLSGQAQDLPP